MNPKSGCPCGVSVNARKRVLGTAFLLILWIVVRHLSRRWLGFIKQPRFQFKGLGLPSSTRRFYSCNEDPLRYKDRNIWDCEHPSYPSPSLLLHPCNIFPRLCFWKIATAAVRSNKEVSRKKKRRASRGWLFAVLLQNCEHPGIRHSFRGDSFLGHEILTAHGAATVKAVVFNGRRPCARSN